MKTILTKNFFLGLIICGLLASFSFFLESTLWAQRFHLSSLSMSLLLGLFLGNTVYPKWAESMNQGISFVLKKLLRLGIILYGFRLTFYDIFALGWKAFALDVFVIGFILWFGVFLGTKIFCLERKISLLISGGAAICGAAAVLAIESSIAAKKHEASLAVATVVLFGTISMFLFPFLSSFFSSSLSTQGIALGATVHEVAQVIGAGSMMQPGVTDIAIVAKLTRVLLLIPVLFLLPLWMRGVKEEGTPEVQPEAKTISYRKIFPWFGLGFFATTGLHSFLSFSPSIISSILTIDQFLLTMAMSALGLETQFQKMKHLGIRPFLLAFILFLVLLLLLTLCLTFFS